MQTNKHADSFSPRKVHEPFDPYLLLQEICGRPTMEFHKEKVGNKLRIIGNPNNSMIILHLKFLKYLELGIQKMGTAGKNLFLLPSATGCVKNSNHFKNAKRHELGKFFYITDVKDAYPSIDLDLLAALIIYILKYDEYKIDFPISLLQDNIKGEKSAWGYHFIEHDPLYGAMCAFLQSFIGGFSGEGLAIGGPASSFLLNLYCEAFVDSKLRSLCNIYGITYSRYVDDFVFSRDKLIPYDVRQKIRACMATANLYVNHKKSKVLSVEFGTLFVTKVGLRKTTEEPAVLTFPQKKRRRLHGIIKSYFAGWNNEPNVIAGIIAEFIYYFRMVSKPTETDQKTFALCKEFESAWYSARKEKPTRREKTPRI